MTIFILLLLAIYCLFIAFAAIGFISLKNKKSTVIKAVTGFSIIIPARNEADNILNCLQSILNNKIDILFEILVIDDCSTDDTATIIRQFFVIHPVGTLISMSDHLDASKPINSYKKKAIEIAIGQSRYDWIVQTDADCLVPKTWLATIMNQAQDPNIHFIAAPVDFLPLKGGLISKLLYWFQSIDFLTMQGITAATHFFKIGQMCNGANLAYRKTSFHEVGGFKDIDGIASGDDMLLLHKFTATYPKGTTYIKSRDAIVKTNAQPSLSAFINQRIRWSSKADLYKDKRLTYLLAIVYIFNLTTLLLFILAIFNTNYLNLALYLLFGKIAVEYLLIIPATLFFKKSNQLLVFPFLQPFHIIYIVAAGFLGKFGKYQWKNRTVK